MTYTHTHVFHTVWDGPRLFHILRHNDERVLGCKLSEKRLCVCTFRKGDIVCANTWKRGQVWRIMKCLTKCSTAYLCLKCLNVCLCLKCLTACLCLKCFTACLCLKCLNVCLCLKCLTACFCHVHKGIKCENMSQGRLMHIARSILLL